jgi:hypothetical protein
VEFKAMPALHRLARPPADSGAARALLVPLHSGTPWGSGIGAERPFLDAPGRPGMLAALHLPETLACQDPATLQPAWNHRSL